MCKDAKWLDREHRLYHVQTLKCRTIIQEVSDKYTCPRNVLNILYWTRENVKYGYYVNENKKQ